MESTTSRPGNTSILWKIFLTSTSGTSPKMKKISILLLILTISSMKPIRYTICRRKMIEGLISTGPLKNLSEAVRPKLPSILLVLKQPALIVWNSLSMEPTTSTGKNPEKKIMKQSRPSSTSSNPPTSLQQVFLLIFLGDLADPHGTHRSCLEILIHLF